MKTQLIKLSAIALFISAGFVANAQNNEDEEWSPEDSLAFVTSVYEDVNKYTDTCIANSSIEPVVVRFENSANVYLKPLSGFNNQQIQIYNSNNQQRPILQYTYNTNNPYIENLPLNESFLIKGVNNCGNTYVIAGFNTLERKVENDEEQHLTISPQIFDLLENYSQEQSNIFDFYDNLISNVDITYYEKLNFTQEYLLRGKSISNKYKIPISTLNGRHFISDITLHIRRGDIEIIWPNNKCICTIVQAHRGTTADQSGYFNGDKTAIVPEYPSDVHRIEQSSGRNQWRAWSRVLASRYEQVWQEFTKKGDPRELDYNATGTSEGDGSNLPKYFVGIDYAYNCFDGFGNRSNSCGCAKDVIIDYSYYANTYVRVRDVKGDSKVSNMAKDFAIISIDNEVDDPLFDYKLIGISGEYEQTINTGKIMEGITPMVKGIFELTTKGAASTASAINSFAESASGFIDAAKNWKTYGGNKYDKDNEAILLLSDKKVTLHPNKKVKVKLFSASHLIAKGQGKWKSTSRTTSHFSLNTYIPYSYNPFDNKGCNNKGFAAWSSGTVLGNGNSIKSEIDNFYLLNSFDGYNYNFVGSINDVSSGIPGLRPGQESEQDIKSLDNANLQFPIKYTVVSMDGKVVGKGNISSNLNNYYRQTIQNSISTFAQGMYIAHIIDATGKVSYLKLIK